MTPNQNIPSFLIEPTGSPEWESWLFETFESYIKPRTLIVGPNISSLVSLLLDKNISIHVCDTENKASTVLATKKTTSSLRMIHDSEDIISNLTDSNKGAFSTLIFVTADGKRSKQALKIADFILRIGGHLILTMPSFTAAYHSLLMSQEEWKEINRAPIKHFLSNYDLLKIRHFNKANTNDSELSFYPPQILAIARKIM
jgi:hypothetical protein